MISERKKTILDRAIREYIELAVPVSSDLLAQKFNFNLSPATIRNEMADLEKMGYFVKPHIAAGRVPTEKGYRFFVDYILGRGECDLTGDQKEKINEVKKFRDERTRFFRELVKVIGAISENLSLSVSILKNGNFCHSGFSGLFRNPEFHNPDIVYKFSEIFDNIENDWEEFFDSDVNWPKIFIGGENPVSGYQDFSLMLTGLNPGREEGIFAIIGPKRMDYSQNLSLLNYTREIIEEVFYDRRKTRK